MDYLLALPAVVSNALEGTHSVHFGDRSLLMRILEIILIEKKENEGIVKYFLNKAVMLNKVEILIEFSKEHQ